MTMWEQLVYLVRGLPDWLAWRMDAWVVRMRDRELSPVVWDIARGSENAAP